MERPSQTFARQLRETRERKGWTQQDLAGQLWVQLGESMDQATVARIEQMRKKNVSLNDVLMLAAALDVAPVHLVVPRNSDDEVQLGDKLRAPARLIRRWFRGERPLIGPEEDLRFDLSPLRHMAFYFNEVSDEDAEARNQPLELTLLHRVFVRLESAIARGATNDALALIEQLQEGLAAIRGMVAGDVGTAAAGDSSNHESGGVDHAEQGRRKAVKRRGTKGRRKAVPERGRS
jgi:transcriptional regulator with XRE-family HTH domain